jgi:catechol 2,3-dioxygenase-like lactoylglutathione lyase family enzyme
MLGAMLRARDRELELMFLACGTARRRRKAQARIAELCASVEFDRFTCLLIEQRLLALAGTRVLEASPHPLPTSFETAVQAARDQAGRDSALLEAVNADLLDRLEQRGIAALALKGPLLARALYSDPALRASEDADLLVHPDDLQAAASAVQAVGWTEFAPELDGAGLPRLHRRLVAPQPWLPTVELHWRVHWYETAFSTAMLAGATSPAGSPRRAAPVDELASLLLFFARDGFVGLRLAADIAAWWDTRGAELAPGALGALVAEHRRLRDCIAASATVARDLVGVPIEVAFAPPPRLGSRARRAVALTNWTRRGSVDQVAANVTLVDGLLAPWRGLPAFFRRQLAPRGEGVWLRRSGAAALHGGKLAARYLIALWMTRAGRRWAPLPHESPQRAARFKLLTRGADSRMADGSRSSEHVAMDLGVTGVSELVLEVVDLEASERFYSEVLGLPVVERWPDREAIWVMAGDRTRIGLWRPQVGLARGRGGIHVHYAMHIPPDRYDAAIEHLRGLGQEVIEHAFPAYQDSRALYVDDPDGNVVELWTWDVANHLRQR